MLLIPRFIVHFHGFVLCPGWKYTDVGEFVATSLGKLCKSTAVPPLPIFNIQLTEVTQSFQCHFHDKAAQIVVMLFCKFLYAN